MNRRSTQDEFAIACHRLTIILLLGMMCSVSQALESAAAAPVVVKQVQEKSLQRQLPISGRVHSRNDVELSLTIAGELETVAEPDTVAEREWVSVTGRLRSGTRR